MVDQHSLSQSPDNSLSRTPACSTTEQAGFSSSITSEFNSDNRLCRHLPTVSCVRHLRCRIIAFFAQFCKNGRILGDLCLHISNIFCTFALDFKSVLFPDRSNRLWPCIPMSYNIPLHPATASIPQQPRPKIEVL